MTATTPSTAARDAGGTAPLEVLALPTPAGWLAVLLTPEDGLVRAAGFCPPEVLLARTAPALQARGTRAAAPRGPVADAVAAYGDGDLAALDAVPLDQPGGPFHQVAWRALREVPAGTTTTYAGLAAAAGRPAAVRGAGSACARNLVVLFVPCHRVVRTGGSLGGYLYGLDVKQQLLHHESR